jgi:hypothetical protein
MLAKMSNLTPDDCAVISKEDLGIMAKQKRYALMKIFDTHHLFRVPASSQ